MTRLERRIRLWIFRWQMRRDMDRWTRELSGLAGEVDEAGSAAEGFIGHKPLPSGQCEHRWRSGQTRVVTCRFADGWHAGRVAFVIEQGAVTLATQDLRRIITDAMEGGGPYDTTQDMVDDIVDAILALRLEKVAAS